MNRKRIMAVVLISAVLVSGCTTIKEKFTRKPKEEEQFRRYVVVREYDVHPSLDLYTKRYIFWKNWHKELLNKLMGDNHKKIVVAIEQDVSNLYDMKRMLVDEKGDKLQEIINQMSDIEDRIKNQRVTGANRVRMRRKLESLGREVKRNYSYTKVRGLIRDDFRTE
ncbi:MAG: hypothetical protein ACE5JK_02885 [Candidatus Omnitrophota bacterium]